MALSEAVLEIAEEMIREADDLKAQNEFVWMTLRNYAKQLKVAVKACEGQVTERHPSVQESLFLHPSAQHFQMVEQERQKLREEKRNRELREAGEPCFAVCKGGPADGDTVSIDPGMPLGARTMIDGGVYALHNGGLDFDEAATRARKEGK